MNSKLTPKKEHTNTFFIKNDEKPKASFRFLLMRKTWNFILLLNVFLLSASGLQAQCNCSSEAACFPNPDLVADCEGLNIILVLDESGSIFNAGVEQDVEQGVMDFVNALNGTPAQLAIVDFSTNAAIVSGYSMVDQNYIDNFIFPYLTHDDVPVPGYTGETYNSVQINSTNWEAALQDVTTIGGANLVVFFTDGNPTAPNGSGNQQQNLDDACDEANALKANGTHLFMLGIGNVEADNLQSISDSDVYDGTNISMADYSLTSDFTQLGSLLEGIVAETCDEEEGTPSIITEKLRSDCVNGQVTFTINIGNTGDGTATNVTMTDNLPNGYSYSSATASTGMINQQNGIVTWSLGDLVPSANASINIIVDVNPSGNYTNTAMITADNIEFASFPSFEGGMPDCCEFSATCDFDPMPQVLEGCDVSVLPPAFTDPDDVFSQIGDNPCGNLVMIFSDDESGTLCPDGLNVTRTYRLFDDLDGDGIFDVDVENSEICVAFFSIRDTEPPNLATPPTFPDLACGAPFPELPTLSSNDECSGEILAVASIDPFVPDYCNGYTVTYRFTATDNCNNSDDVTTSFFVEPAPLPTITCPDIAPIECTAAADYEPIPASYSNGLPIPCDILGFVEGEVIAEDYDACGGTLTIRYIWENPCDDIEPSFAPVIQDCIIEVLPAPVPTISCPALAPISCELVDTYVPPMADFNNNIDGVCNNAGQVSGTVTATTVEDGCIQSLTITYSGVDECDFALAPITCVVEVFDDVAPMITCPSDLVNLPCDAETPAADINLVSATDNCTSPDEIEISFIGDTDNAGTGCPGNPYIVTRTYQAEDACGNITPCTQTISFAEDTEGPEWVNCVPETTITCEADLNESLNFPTLIDEPCRGFTIVDNTVEVTGEPGCPGTQYMYSFMATDPCGRVATCMQVYTIAPQELEIECPEELTVACNDPNKESIIQDWLNSAGNDITTPCSNPVIVTDNYSPEGFSGGCGNNLTGSQIVSFFVMDGCGRSTSCDVALHVVDTEAPTIIRPAMDEMRPCGDGLEFQFQAWLADNATATAFDDCGGVTWSTIPENPVLDGLNSVEVIFVAADACGNTTETTASFIPMDNNPPIITVPAESITIECSEGGVEQVFQDWLDNYGYAEAFDLCGPITWSIAGEIPTLNYRCDGSTNPIFVDFVATDEAGNEAFTTGIFDVNDFIAPVFSFVPEDITVSCDASNVDGDYAFGTPLVADACSNVDLSFEDETVDSECGFHLIRTWTATDDCGNMTTATQTINVIDTEAPELFFNHPDLIGVEDGDEVSFNCDDNFIFSINDVTAVDDCSSNVDISIFDYNALEGNCSEDGFYRQMVCTWTAVDACGNLTELTITMIITDDEAPTFTSHVEDMTIDCRDTPPVTPPSVTDNCTEEVHLEFVDTPFTEDCQNGFEIIRTWIATDDCGNIATLTQTFTIEASPGPVFSLLSTNVNITCGEMENITPPTCVSHCGNYILTHEDLIMSEDCSENMNYLRTWTATDECGISSTATQMIVMQADVSPPVLTAFPADKFITCSEIPTFNEIEATDNCNAVTLSFEDTRLENGCDDIYTRTWTATDACGNATVQTQNIIRIPDTITPDFMSIPANGLVLNCGDEADLLMPEVSDNCGIDRLLKEDEIINGDCTDSYDVLRTWTVVDYCGNARSVQRTFTVELDNTAPIFLDVPDGYSVHCGEAITFGTPTFIDYCSEVVLTSADATSDEVCEGSGYSVTRAWTATDACGNSRIARQTIQVMEDTEAPVMAALEDYAVACDILEITLSVPEVSDNCSEVTVTYEDEIGEGTCESGYEIERTWTAADACGNTTVQTQIIQVSQFGGTNGLVNETPVSKGLANTPPPSPQTTTPSTKFNIYPNPAQHQLFLQLTHHQVETGFVRIFTTTGQLLKTMVISNLDDKQTIEIDELNTGLYILQITLGTEQHQSKFMKM